MFERRPVHPSDEQLADERFAAHLASCPGCRRRLEEMRAAFAAYTKYRDAIRGPMQPQAPHEWPGLRTLVAEHEANRPSKRSYRWPALIFAAAACAAAASLVFRLAERPAARVPEEPQAVVAAKSEAPRNPAVTGPAITKNPAAEKTVSPSDLLRVYLKLDELGADVGEPLEVSEDFAQNRIEVRSNGLPAERRQEIEAALRPLPRVAFLVGSAGAGGPSKPGRATERASTDIPAAMARELDNLLGGAVRRQEMTDEVLESSATALARAHAIAVLADKFPPETEAALAADDRERLNALVHHHLSELRRLTAAMRAQLEPLLHAQDLPVQSRTALGSWQAGVPALVSAARECDTLLNRLLAGSYSQAEGNEMLSTIGRRVGMLDDAVKAEELR